MEHNLECLECGWQGEYDDLIDSEECPGCGGVDIDVCTSTASVELNHGHVTE